MYGCGKTCYYKILQTLVLLSCHLWSLEVPLPFKYQWIPQRRGPESLSPRLRGARLEGSEVDSKTDFVTSQALAFWQRGGLCDPTPGRYSHETLGADGADRVKT